MGQSQFVSHCTADAMVLAAQKLIDGHLVAFPTETVYGLGADATNKEAIAQIYAAKGRPADHPLIVHVHSMAPWVIGRMKFLHLLLLWQEIFGQGQ